MIQAKDIVLAVSAVTGPPVPDVSVHVAAIDAMLSEPWRKDELEDDDGPEGSDSNYAGRSYNVKELLASEMKEICRLYRDSGWTVVLHGNRTDTAYTDRKSAGRWLRFIPPHAKSSWIRR